MAFREIVSKTNQLAVEVDERRREGIGPQSGQADEVELALVVGAAFC